MCSTKIGGRRVIRQGGITSKGKGCRSRGEEPKPDGMRGGGRVMLQMKRKRRTKAKEH